MWKNHHNTLTARATLIDAGLVVHLAAGRAVDRGCNADHLADLERRLEDLAGWLVDVAEAGTVGAVDSTKPLPVSFQAAS